MKGLSAWRWAWVALGCFCLLVGRAGSSQAQPPTKPHRVVVLSVLAEAESRGLDAKITRVLRVETQRNGGYEVVDNRDLSLPDVLGVLGCEEPSPDCMDTLAKYLSVDRVIFGQMIPSGELWDISVNIYDAHDRRVVARWGRRFSEQVDILGFFTPQMAEFLGGRGVVSPTQLRIVCNVADAQVLVDGALVGQAPYLGESFAPGRHEITVRREGYTSWRRSVELVEGEGRGYNVTLKPLEAGGTHPTTHPTPHPSTDTQQTVQTYGWVLLSSGAVVMGVGGFFGLAASDTHEQLQGTTIERDAAALVEEGELQKNLANVLYGVGGVGMLTGVVLLVASRGGTEDAPTSWELGPRPEGGAEVRWLWRW